MKIRENSRFYKVQMVFTRIRHGLFLFTLQNFLGRIGLDIRPYYWVQEGKQEFEEPKIRDDFKDYCIEQIGTDEIDIMDNIMGLDVDQLKKDLKEGQLCLGLKHRDEIAAVTFVQPNTFIFRHREFKLQENQAYLLNMYTFQSHRGKNLAPFLRYHCYRYMEKQGKDSFYSITSYFNKSSRRFKEKLHAKNLKLLLYVGLFKRWHWNFVLSDYDKQGPI